MDDDFRQLPLRNPDNLLPFFRMDQIVQIDTQRIRDEIDALTSRINRLKMLLEGVDELREFCLNDRGHARKRSSKEGPGRPRANPLLDKLTEWIAAQSHSFTNDDMREAVKAEDRHVFGSAIRSLVKDGILVVETKPVGRRPGVYRKAG